MGKPGTLERAEQNVAKADEAPLAGEAQAAWSKHSPDPKIARMECLMDDKIKATGASDADQKAMKTIAHALAEGDEKALDKAVKSLAKDPEALARIAKELDDAMLKTGLRVHVSFNSKDKVLEFDNQSGNNRLMIPVDGKPMGNYDGVHYDDYDKGSKSFRDMQKPMMEGNSHDVAKDISKDMLKRYSQRAEDKELVFH